MEVTLLLRVRPQWEASRIRSRRNSRDSRRPTGSPAWSCSRDSVSSSHPPLIGAGTAPVAANDVLIDQLSDGISRHGSTGGSDEDAERSTDERSHAGAEQRSDGGRLRLRTGSSSRERLRPDRIFLHKQDTPFSHSFRVVLTCSTVPPVGRPVRRAGSGCGNTGQRGRDCTSWRFR